MRLWFTRPVQSTTMRFLHKMGWDSNHPSGFALLDIGNTRCYQQVATSFIYNVLTIQGFGHCIRYFQNTRDGARPGRTASHLCGWAFRDSGLPSCSGCTLPEGIRRDSNPHKLDPQSSALPICHEHHECYSLDAGECCLLGTLALRLRCQSL